MSLFSLSHILYLLIITLFCLGFYFLFKNKSKKTQSIAIFSILFLSFIIHFFKLLLPEYRNELPYSLQAITFESICAISTLTFPFIFISKNKALKDYMIIIGIISGVATLLLPLQATSNNFFNLNTIRFFYAHFAILFSALFMLLFKLHTLSNHWIKHTLIIFFLVCILMTINNTIFIYFAYGQDALKQYLNA